MWEAFFGKVGRYALKRTGMTPGMSLYSLRSFPRATCLQSEKGPLCLEDAGCVRNDRPAFNILWASGVAGSAEVEPGGKISPNQKHSLVQLSCYFLQSVNISSHIISSCNRCLVSLLEPFLSIARAKLGQTQGRNSKLFTETIFKLMFISHCYGKVNVVDTAWCPAVSCMISVGTGGTPLSRWSPGIFQQHTECHLLLPSKVA